MPRIFLISHYRERASEVWLHRVRVALAPHLVGEAYFDIGNTTSYSNCNLMPAWWSTVLKLGIANDKKFAPPRKAALLRAIACSEADIVYCHFANLAVRLRTVWDQTDLPVVVHCHGFDISFDLLNSKGQRRYGASYQQQIADLSRRCQLISNSEFTRANLVRHGVAEHRVLTWHFGVPLAVIHPQHSTEVKQILFLGRFIGCKGPIETLRSFAIAVRRGLNAKLVMAGDGPLFNVCCKLTIELGMEDWISFPGSVSTEVATEFFRSSQLFTAHTQMDPVTNQCEAFGVAFAEALGAGLPVITGQHGGPATFLTHESNALLFPPGDVEAHAAALLRLANDHTLRSELSRNAIETVKQRFDLNRQHELLLNHLMTVARGSR